MTETHEEYIQRMDKLRLQEIRKAQYDRLIPQLYQKTCEDRLPREQIRKILDWEYGSRGLLAIGPTGTGKTRCMYMLIGRLFASDYKIATISSTRFAHRVSTLAWDGGLEHWLEKVATAPVLFLDDLGQEKMTERVASALADTVERRTNSLLPILTTTNAVGDLLAQQLGPINGPPTVRRLREFCEEVRF